MVMGKKLRVTMDMGADGKTTRGIILDWGGGRKIEFELFEREPGWISIRADGLLEARLRSCNVLDVRAVR